LHFKNTLLYDISFISYNSWTVYRRKAATGSQEEIQQQQQQLPCHGGWEEEATDPAALCTQPEALGETLSNKEIQRSVQGR
jgi:hypothetical protein